MNEIAALLRDFGQGASNAAASNVSGPVDLLAWALRKGGVPVPSNPILGSEWMRQKGLLADPRNKIAGLLGEAAGMSAPIAAAAKAPQIARGLLAADDVATAGANRMADHFERTGAAFKGPPNQRGAIVWHGSPHKFDAFDASKIGTGEGAQAYGHGLYLAESPSVAKSYADTLSQYHIGTRDGMKSGGDFADALVANAGDYPASLSSAIRSQANKVATDLAGGKTAEQVIASMRNGPYARMYAGLADAVEKMSPTKAGGSLYKVDLPDNAIARMLDWDKPLSQQAPEVQKVFEPRVAPLRKEYAKPAPGWGDLADGSSYNPTGRELLELMRNRSSTSAQDFLGNGLGPQVSQQLRQAGIPGIRYLDGGSRGAGTGTSNYVVFPGEESALRILERNGNPINALVQALKGPR